MIVDWSDLALNDLEDIKHYISKDSPYYARELVESIFLSVERLIDFPHSGRSVPEADDNNIREIIVQSYRVMYQVNPGQILILAVMHGRRDLNNPKNQPWDPESDY